MSLSDCSDNLSEQRKLSRVFFSYTIGYGRKDIRACTCWPYLKPCCKYGLDKQIFLGQNLRWSKQACEFHIPGLDIHKIDSWPMGYRHKKNYGHSTILESKCFHPRTRPFLHVESWDSQYACGWLVQRTFSRKRNRQLWNSYSWHQ